MAITPNFESSSGEKKWIKEIQKIVEEVIVDIEVPASIFSIPATLASLKPKAYMPQLLGLGPYHHCDPNLYDMERCKLVAARLLIQEDFKTLEFEQLVHQLMDIEDEVRACYHRYLDIEGKTLMWILAIDGLFLLKFLQIFKNKGHLEAPHLVDFHGRKWSHDAILSDIMLLENQIPFSVLRKFMSIQISSDDIHDSNLITFCHSISPVKLKEDFPSGVFNRFHLLDLLYYMIVAKWLEQSTQEETEENVAESEFKSNSSQQVNSISDSCQIITVLWSILSVFKVTKKAGDIDKRISSDPEVISLAKEVIEDSIKAEFSNINVEKIMIPSALNLSKMAGVEFCPTDDEISFDEKEKKFYLPVITLDIHSEVIIRNLIAYEASTVSGSLVFARYAELLDRIIDTAEDAKFLREKKIIVNKLKSDEQVFQLFDGIGKSVRLTHCPLLDKTIADVNKFFYNSRKVRIYKGAKKYVFDSWKILTVFASILLLLLTALQSFCSAYTCSHRINSAISN